jgi:hypothetical protein
MLVVSCLTADEASILKYFIKNSKVLRFIKCVFPILFQQQKFLVLSLTVKTDM